MINRLSISIGLACTALFCSTAGGRAAASTQSDADHDVRPRGTELDRTPRTQD